MPAISDGRGDPALGNLLSGTSRAVTLPGVEMPPGDGLQSILPPAAPEGGDVGSSGSIWRLIARVFIENKLAVVGLVILVVMFAFCFFGPFIYHSDQSSVILRPIASPGSCGGSGLIPGPPCPLGTDNQGYDVLGRLMLAGQSYLEVGPAAAAVATLR